MAQTSYNLYMAAAHIGLVADNGFHDIISAAAEVDILFGSALVQGTDPDVQVKVPTATGQIFRGVAISTWNTTQDVDDNGLYFAKKAVNVLKKGRVWVEVNSNVVPGAAAYFVYTGSDVGLFRNDNTDADAVPTGVFRTTTASGELAVLEINLP